MKDYIDVMKNVARMVIVVTVVKAALIGACVMTEGMFKVK